VTQDGEKEFIFVDESGDPGPDGNPIYILLALHVAEPTLDRIRRHLVAFRYHHDVTRELKVQRWADKFSAPARHLLGFMADLAEEGFAVTTGNWLQKDRYRAGGGPYLTTTEGEAVRFRNYQLRRLLERHAERRRWSSAVDVVIDRWRMSAEQRRNLEEYLRGNFKLRPAIRWITLVDSSYCDTIQAVDIFSRLVRRCVTARGTPDEMALCARLVDLEELRGGLE
jgi:hypothetical protein